MKVRYSMFFVLLSSVSFVSAAQDAANPFRLLMELGEIERRLELAEQYIERSKTRASNPDWPIVGVRVTGLAKGGNAQRAGIETGSTIVKRGDYLPWSGFAPEIALPDSHIVTLIDPEDNVQTVTVDGGSLRAGLDRSYSLEIAYLRDKAGTRNPDWDREMIAACVYCQSDKVLSESLLHLAVEQGCPQDLLTDFFQVLFQTYAPSGPDEAIDRFLKHFPSGAEAPWFYIPPLHEAAVVTGRIDLMKFIAERAGENCVFDENTIAKFLGWTNGEIRFPKKSLLQRAVENHGPSIANRIFSNELDVPGGKRPGPRLDEPLEVARGPGEMFNVEYLWQGMPHNIHYHLKAKLSASGQPEPGKGPRSHFRLLLANLYENAYRLPRIERLSMASSRLHRQVIYVALDRLYGVTTIRTAGSSLPGIEQGHHRIAYLPYVKDPELPDYLADHYEASKERWSREAETITFDLIRYGCEVGVYINGVSVLHLPTDPNPARSVDFNLHSAGINIVSEDQDMWEISALPVQEPGI